MVMVETILTMTMHTLNFNLDVATERAKGKLDYEGPDKVVVNGRSMNIQTGITVYGNEGHTNLPATSRAARLGLAYPASRLCKCAGPIRFAFIRIVSKQGRAKKYSIEKVKLS